MNKYKLLFLCTLAVFTGTCIANIKVGTYNSPPFSMYEDGETIGLATESLVDLLTKAGVKDYTILHYPLARGVAELKSGTIQILYPVITSLNNEYENFVLIGPITIYRIGLFVPKDYPTEVSIAALSDQVIAAERGSISNKLLQEHKIRTEQTTKEISCLNMALAQRVSACALGILPGMYVSAINSKYQDFKYTDTSLSADMYVALSKDLPAATIQAIQDTFAKLKQENYFVKKQQEYEKKFELFIQSLA